MSWVQLGLFIEGSLPTRIEPKKRKVKKAKPPSKSKPIRKARKEKYITLASGELDDSLDGVFP